MFVINAKENKQCREEDVDLLRGVSDILQSGQERPAEGMLTLDLQEGNGQCKGPETGGYNLHIHYTFKNLEPSVAEAE